MTIKKTATRDIDNRRLYSLQIGDVFMPALGKHVPCEGYGERAALMLADRLDGLREVVSQPERMRLVVRGKKVAYTPDLELFLTDSPNEVWEIKGDKALQDPLVLEKLAVAEIEVIRTGRRFHVRNSQELTQSDELRNVQLLRRYARWPVTEQQIASVRSVFRTHTEIPLGLLIETAAQYGIQRAQIYALLYRNALSMTWTRIISDDSMIRCGKVQA